jgi:hypothetical protein
MNLGIIGKSAKCYVIQTDLMKIKSTMAIVFVIASVALATITVGAIIGFPTLAFVGEQQQQERFIAELTGVEQIPPVNHTSAIGVAEFKLGQDNIMYIVNVTDIENVTAVHIHSGQVGENGPVVVTLFKEDLQQQRQLLLQL